MVHKYLLCINESQPRKESCLCGRGATCFSSESVTEGHPDKIADKISDSVLDAMIAQDPKSRVACETLVTTGLALVAGEITSKAIVDIPQLVRDTVKSIGYTDASMGFDCETCAVMVSLDKQSQDISIGVSQGEGMFKEQGAGDQGIMFGFASDETPQLMPMAIQYAHSLTEHLSIARKKEILPFLRPDGKSQVTVRYEDGKPGRVDTVVIAAQHTPDVKYEDLKQGIIEEVIKKVIPPELLVKENAVPDKRYWQIRGRGAAWRLRVDWTKNSCGYVRRVRRSWRWSSFWQGSQQSGSFGSVHGSTCC